MEYVKSDYRGKKLAHHIIDAASSGELIAYIKHPPTGAMIPIDPIYISKMKNGETVELQEAERKYNRRYFKVEKLKIRWDMDSDEVIRIFESYKVPVYFLRNEVTFEEKHEADDFCFFEEYVLAIEKKNKLKKKEVKSKYHGSHRH